MARDYPERPVAAVSIAVLREDAVLLVRRGKAPGLGQWQLPGGKHELGESAVEAALRELREETGLLMAAGALQLATHADVIKRDADGAVQYHYVLLVFWARDPGGEPRAGSDAAECAFVGFERLEEIGVPAETQTVLAQIRGMGATPR